MMVCTEISVPGHLQNEAIIKTSHDADDQAGLMSPHFVYNGPTIASQLRELQKVFAKVGSSSCGLDFIQLSREGLRSCGSNIETLSRDLRHVLGCRALSAIRNRLGLWQDCH